MTASAAKRSHRIPPSTSCLLAVQRPCAAHQDDSTPHQCLGDQTHSAWRISCVVLSAVKGHAHHRHSGQSHDAGLHLAEQLGICHKLTPQEAVFYDFITNGWRNSYGDSCGFRLPLPVWEGYRTPT